MSDTNDLPTTADSQSVACATVCKHRRSVILRAALYTPVVLVLSALGAVAMFPNLADYASPIIGESHCSNCPIRALCSLMGVGQSCPSQSVSENSTLQTPCGAAASAPCGGCKGSQACTSESDSSPSVSVEASADEVTSVQSTIPAEEVSADAFSSSNVVKTESLSN